jgi:hypothetical protein
MAVGERDVGGWDAGKRDVGEMDIEERDMADEVRMRPVIWQKTPMDTNLSELILP